METAVSTTAEELLGGTPPAKKQRPLLPPGVKVKPVYPGATYGIHPVDKMGIKLVDAEKLETPLPAGATPPPPPTPTTTTPPPPAPEPEKPKPEPEPEMKTGDAPDFSDLPKSDAPGNGATPGTDQQQTEPTPDEMRTAYGHMAGMLWDSIIRLLAALFGDFWLPKTPDERKMVIDSFVTYFDSVAMQALTPLQNLWMAISLYCLPRTPGTISKIMGWFKNRKRKRNDAPKPDKEEKNSEQPIDVEAEVIGRGPGV